MQKFEEYLAKFIKTMTKTKMRLDHYSKLIMWSQKIWIPY